MKIPITILSIVLAWLPLGSARAAPVKVDAVEVELVAERVAVVPGETFRMGLRIRHDPHWHTYWRNPGDSGLPTTLELTTPTGITTGPLQWPAPRRIPLGPLVNYGYEGEIVLPIEAKADPGLATDRVHFTGRAQWLMCKDVCIPGEADLSLELPVARGTTLGRSAHASAIESAITRLPGAALPIRAWTDGEQLRLVFPATPEMLAGEPTGSAWFLPYREGLIENALEQRGGRVDTPPAELGRDPPSGAGWRALSVPLAATVDLEALRKAGTFGAVSGLLLLPGGAWEALPVEAAPLTVSWETTQRVATPALTGATQKADPTAPTSLTLALLFAFVGGLVLNLMPCVFPVIALKVLGFAGQEPSQARRRRSHAVGFAAGVLVSFWILAGILLALRAGGQGAGWGFQLQSPAFVAAMSLLFVLIGLNLSGLFEIGSSLTRLGAIDRGGQSLPASFGSGVLAVLVASPCTAPFMGGALGYTLSQPAAVALLVFTALGVGMALPYLLLGLNPRLLAWMPKPGRWMQTLREFLAFPMYATAAWLAWVLALQVGADGVLMIGIGAVILALAAWLYGRFAQRAGAPSLGWTVLAAAVAALGLWIAWPPQGVADDPGASMSRSASGSTAAPDAWQPWSEKRVADILSEGRPVFVDFTAAWCVTCQANKRLVLETDAVRAAMASKAVVRLRADWTRRDTSITEALARHGRNGVPLYLLYSPAGSAPSVLPEVLTPALVIDALGALPPAR